MKKETALRAALLRKLLRGTDKLKLSEGPAASYQSEGEFSEPTSGEKTDAPNPESESSSEKSDQ